MSADAAPHEPAKIVLRIKGEAIEHIFKLGTDLRVKVRFEGKGKIGGHVVTTSLYLPACMEGMGDDKVEGIRARSMADFFYERTHGLPKDYEQAAYWYAQVVNGNHKYKHLRQEYIELARQRLAKIDLEPEELRPSPLAMEL